MQADVVSNTVISFRMIQNGVDINIVNGSYVLLVLERRLYFHLSISRCWAKLDRSVKHSPLNVSSIKPCNSVEVIT